MGTDKKINKKIIFTQELKSISIKLKKKVIMDETELELLVPNGGTKELSWRHSVSLEPHPPVIPFWCAVSLLL